MATYIKLAKRKRAECLKSGASKKRKKAKPSIEKDIEEQMMVILKPECGCNIYTMSFLGLHVQIHVGRMLHSHKMRKGILVPHDTPVQIMLHKNCSYEHMVERCRKEVFPDDDADDATAHYYVANSTGACIASGEVINGWA